MNLKDFYSQTQAMKVLQMPHKMQIHRWRNKIHKCLGRKPSVLDVCNKPFYLRHDVDNYMLSLLRGKPERLEFEKLRNKQMRWDIDLKEWLPACQAKEYINYGHDTLYKLATYQNNPVHFIRSRKVKIGTEHFYFFNKADLQFYLVKGKTPYDARTDKNVWQPNSQD